MSDLFIILGIVAALLIGGVAIYNKIQERNYRKRSEEAFHQRHDDVLLGEESAPERNGRIEPQLTDAANEPPIGGEEGEPQREMDRPWANETWEANQERTPGFTETAARAPDEGMRGVSEPVASAAAGSYERRATPRQETRTSIPPGSLRQSTKTSIPPGSLREPAKTIPPGHLREPAKTSIPPGSLREKSKASIPPGSLPEPTKTSIPPGSMREPARSSIPPGSLREERPPQLGGRGARTSIPAGSMNGQSRPSEPQRATKKPVEFDPPHPSLDYVARIELEKPLPAAAFAQLISQTRELGKPVRFAGLNALTGGGEELSPGSPATYKELRVGLQMADRSGPATDVQIARFGDILRRAAAGLRARAICPPLHQALASAIELDQFCADVDVTIGLNIVARRNQPFAGSRLAPLAEAIGFKLAANGHFEFAGDDGHVIFSLCDQDGAAFIGGRINGMSSKGVTLLLDVPRVAEGLPAFEAMVTIANDLCEPLEGVLVDDNGKPLSERGIETIRAQLRDIYGKMQARQISAGSPRARRLFSSGR